jgi:hypothetical protein
MKRVLYLWETSTVWSTKHVVFKIFKLPKAFVPGKCPVLINEFSRASILKEKKKAIT